MSIQNLDPTIQPPYPLEEFPWYNLPTYIGNFGTVHNVEFEVEEYIPIYVKGKLIWWLALLKASVFENGNDAILQKLGAMSAPSKGVPRVIESTRILENAGGGGPYDKLMGKLVQIEEDTILSTGRGNNFTFKWRDYLNNYRHHNHKIFEELIKIDSFNRKCEFIIPSFELINDELLAYISHNPEALQMLEWRKFEELLEAIFKNHGFRTVLGPGRGDGGVDLRLINNDSVGSVITLVQAKRYKTKNPISLEAVSALYGTVEMERANRGLFVTTSRYLPSAKKFAESTGNRLVLANSDEVAKWCKFKL